jgi:Phage portal protein, SPP1 Gp6-like
MQAIAAPATTDQPRYEITAADKERLEDIAAAWKAYHGELEPPLERMPDQADDNVLVNHCLPIVEAGNDFLFGQELEISIGKSDPDKASVALDQAWGKKEARMPLLQKLHTNGAICRNAFLRIVPSKIKSNRAQTFRMVVLDPATCYIQTAPGDVETVLRYCIQYSIPSTANGQAQQTYYREEISRIDPDGNALAGEPDDDDTWMLQKWTQEGQPNMEPIAGKWVPDGKPIVWDYAFPPMFHCQNLPLPNDAWGMPDITKGIINLNNALNLAKSCLNRNNKLLAQPVLAGSGMEGKVSLAPGHVNIHSPEGKMYSVQIHSDIAGSLAHIKDLREDVDQESHVPSVASGRMESIPRLTSGIAVELMYQTLLMKNGKKRCTYGKLILDVSHALLVLSGLSEDMTITLPWQSPLPKTDLASVQAGALKITGMGISEMTIQEEYGYDPEQEAERVAEEAQTKLDMFAKGQGMPPQVPTQPGQPGVPPEQQQPPASTPFIGRQGGQA